MDVVARETRFVTGRVVSNGGAGDSSVLTAYGVFQGMRAAAEHRWGTPSLAGRRVGIAGLGKVGKHLAGHLLDDGATWSPPTSPSGRSSWARPDHPEVDLVADADALIREPTSTCTRRAPSAARSTTTPLPALRAKIVAGAAQQPARPSRASRSCWPTGASSTRPTTW